MSDSEEKEILEQLTLMGYSGPDWDKYHINKPMTINPPPTLSTVNINPVEMTKKQLFVIKAWLKVVGFYQEDEDPSVIANSQTVRKNGQVTRIFRMCFDNEQATQRYQFVFEKKIDGGLEGLNEDDIRQTWAKTVEESIPIVEEKFLYSRSFDTQASSSKFKSNSEDGVVSSFQKNFLREIKNSLVEAYQNTESLVQEDESTRETEDHEFFKGKEFQFEEKGNHITWTVSIRQIDNLEVLRDTWYVNATATETSSPPSEEEKGTLSPNPFELNEDNDEKNSVQQQELDRQLVEEKIMEFIGDVWPKIRNFYLEMPDDDINFATNVARKNGYPTRMLELHFDTLSERNRWKFLFEISVASDGIPQRTWAQLDPSTTDNYFEARTYGSYEKRTGGTSSQHGEDKNDYFTGFYKRWFLNEVQWKLVKAFAQTGYSLIDPKTFDAYRYKFGKDLEFASQRDQITWSFSIQKVAKYPANDAPLNVWCYCISDNFITPTTGELDDLPHNETDQLRLSRIDIDSKMERGPTKSKSRIRTLARNIVKPVMEKTSWLKGSSTIFRNKKKGVQDVKSKDDQSEKTKTLEREKTKTLEKQGAKNRESKTKELPLAEPLAD